MKNLLVLIGLTVVLLGCKKLDGDNTYYLRENCEDLKAIIEGKLISIDKKKGVHYVNVDTVNCVLNVKFETSKDSLTWLGDTLEVLGYLSVEELSDSVIVEEIDTLLHVPTKEVEVIDNTEDEKVEEKPVVEEVKEVVVKDTVKENSVIEVRSDTVIKVDTTIIEE